MASASCPGMLELHRTSPRRHHSSVLPKALALEAEHAQHSGHATSSYSFSRMALGGSTKEEQTPLRNSTPLRAMSQIILALALESCESMVNFSILEGFQVNRIVFGLLRESGEHLC